MTKKKHKSNISRLMEKANIKQSELARALGVSHTAVGMWQKGETVPRTTMLPRIATILRCDIADFF